VITAKPTIGVLVLSRTAGRYHRQLQPDRRGWLCGRCEQGVLVAPQIGDLCPVCQAEVIATRPRHRAWLLLILLALLVAWLAMTWSQ
jgi:hypothetical protein